MVCLKGEEGDFLRVVPVTIGGDWLVPRRYVKPLAEGTEFHHVIFVDRKDQNIATMERIDKGKWAIRSMNPATTGVHRPPYAQEGVGGYAPYASRFTNGAYIHGVPVNVPQTAMIEYSWSLGTTPRSHMCVRNATSHAKFVFDRMPTGATLVVVIE